MDQESMKKLRLDRRLQNRRGWIDQADVEAALQSLPDSADKVASEDESGETAAAPAPAAAAPSFATPATGTPEGGGN